IEIDLPEIIELQLISQIFIQGTDRASARVLEHVAIVHLDEVGCIAPGNLRRKTRPVIVPAHELGVDGDTGIGLREHVDGSICPTGTLVTAPPDHANIGALLRESAGGGQQRKACNSQPGAHKATPTKMGHVHVILPRRYVLPACRTIWTSSQPYPLPRLMRLE